ILATEKTLRSPEFQEIAKRDLAPGEQQRIEAALAALKAVIGGDDRDVIHEKTHELNDATRHLAEVSMNRSVHAALSGRNLSEMQDDEADRLDTAWELTTRSRLGCQAVIKGDVVCELPMYTRNYVQEGGGIQLGKSEKREAKAAAEVTR